MAETVLSKNTIRLADFEQKTNSLQEKTTKVENKINEYSENISNLQNQISQIKNETEQKLNESNDLIKTTIKNNFENELTQGENQINDNLNNINILKQEIEELYKKINDNEEEANEKLIKYRKNADVLETLKRQYQMVKENYDEAFKENQNLKIELDNRKLNLNTLDVEIEDMKKVIAKLVDARIILNKYFSTHYENFTEDEKRLIQEIEGNVFPEINNNNHNLPDINQQNQIISSFGPNNNNMEKLKGSNNLRYSNNNYNYNNNFNNNYNYNNYNNQGRGNYNRILNEQEYAQYQQKLKNEAPPQIGNQNRLGNSVQKSYVGPDDDYWYEQNRKF